MNFTVGSCFESLFAFRVILQESPILLEISSSYNSHKAIKTMYEPTIVTSYDHLLTKFILRLFSSTTKHRHGEAPHKLSN